MSATYQWWGEYGTSGSSTTADLGVSGNLFNFKAIDSLASPADYTSYPITAGNNSYELWIKMHFSGTFAKVQNAKFWKSSGGPDDGISLKWDGATTAYATPTTANSTVATADVPTASPGSANVSFDGNLAGSLTAAGYTDYIVLQMQTTTAAGAGDTSTYTFALTYEEN
jgi:hypothetical protein